MKRLLAIEMTVNGRNLLFSFALAAALVLAIAVAGGGMFPAAVAMAMADIPVAMYLGSSYLGTLSPMRAEGRFVAAGLAVMPFDRRSIARVWFVLGHGIVLASLLMGYLLVGVGYLAAEGWSWLPYDAVSWLLVLVLLFASASIITACLLPMALSAKTPVAGQLLLQITSGVLFVFTSFALEGFGRGPVYAFGPSTVNGILSLTCLCLVLSCVVLTLSFRACVRRYERVDL